MRTEKKKHHHLIIYFSISVIQIPFVKKKKVYIQLETYTTDSLNVQKNDRAQGATKMITKGRIYGVKAFFICFIFAVFHF